LTQTIILPLPQMNNISRLTADMASIPIGCANSQISYHIRCGQLLAISSYHPPVIYKTKPRYTHWKWQPHKMEWIF